MPGTPRQSAGRVVSQELPVADAAHPGERRYQGVQEGDEPAEEDRSCLAEGGTAGRAAAYGAAGSGGVAAAYSFTRSIRPLALT